MNAPDAHKLRLTSFSHGGGCGCKIAPGVLSEILKHAGNSLPAALMPKQLLVGIETADDAAVYKLNDQQALVATTDFFMPIVDDPHDFGRIAATNAISDVYAMGGRPIFALALLAMPINQLPLDTIRQIVAGGESICSEAGIPIAGGHTIDSVEPIYGLVVLGLVHPDKVRKNSGARAGDVLVLGKPLGVGIYSAALKKEQLDAAGYAEMIDSTTKLNTPGTAARGAAGRARADRRDRLRTARPSARGLQGLGARRHGAPRGRAAAAARARARRAGLRDRRLGPQLGRLRRGNQPARRHRGAACAAHRSADQRRPAGRLRAGHGRRGARHLPQPGLCTRGGDRRAEQRSACRRPACFGARHGARLRVVSRPRRSQRAGIARDGGLRGNCRALD